MIIVDMPVGAGPCVKQVVTATIVAPNGDRWIATNYCQTPQTTCARAGMPTGVGYGLCWSACRQPGHAEINALAAAGGGALGATLYVEGPTYACDSCARAAAAAGIVAVIIGAPPCDS
jgi:deoxycytidylate deaminase